MKPTYLRSIITGFCLLLFGVLSIQAASLRGIRIESTDGPIVVYLNGEQVCTPSVSCFIANLSGGYYEVAVYATRHSGRQERGKLVYNERVYYAGRDIKEISLGGMPDHRPSRPGVSDREEEMSRNSFEEFYRLVKDKSFDSDRTKTIETALVTARFTSAQCKRLLETFSFDSGKMKIMQLMYPQIVDKENFFRVIETLTFESEKNSMNDFIKKYHARRN